MNIFKRIYHALDWREPKPVIRCSFCGDVITTKYFKMGNARVHDTAFCCWGWVKFSGESYQNLKPIKI
jgi:hypothetical protein